MLLHALDFIEGPSYEVIISGRKEKSKEILSSLYKSEQLNKVLIFNDENSVIGEEFLFLAPYVPNDNGETLVYVCKNYICSLPSSNMEEILTSLKR